MYYWAILLTTLKNMGNTTLFNPVFIYPTHYRLIIFLLFAMLRKYCGSAETNLNMGGGGVKFESEITVQNMYYCKTIIVP